MRSSRVFFILLYLWNYFLLTDATALLKPSHRGVTWTRGAFNSAGYNYMEINCGGIARLKNNNGRCGLCGDAYNGPRNHETGGKYATGTVSQVVGKGERNMNVKVLLNSDRRGYFEFRLCESNGTAETQACFDKNLLKITEGRFQGDEFAYIVERAGVIPLTVEIPEKVYCEKCVLQWKYVTGNTFGRDEHGVGCLGCGHQETYINCADITIKGWEMPPTPAPTIPPAPTTTMIWTTMAWTTPTPVPSTTASPTPPPTTRAPTTTTIKPTKPTKPRTTQNTQRVYVSRQRQAVTDADEGSRQHVRNVKERNSNGYSLAVAPPQTPAVPPSRRRSPIPKGVPVPIKPDPVIQPKTTQTPKIVRSVQMSKADSLPKLNLREKTKNRERKRFVPFKIPRPPMLSNEQIDALNNNKNVLPHHDPLQKYIKVGSSSIVASVDFTTMRAQQVQTPPTRSRNEIFKSRSTAATLNFSARNISPRIKSDTKKKSPDMFSSFGNEMLGFPAKLPPSQKQRFGSNLMNEYSMPINTAAASFKGSRQGKAGQKNNYQKTSGDLFSEFAFENPNAINNKKTPDTKAREKYGPSASRANLRKSPPFFVDNSQVSTSNKRYTPLKENRLSPTNKNSQFQGRDTFGASSSRYDLSQQSDSKSSGSQRSPVFTGHQQAEPLFNEQQQLYGPAQRSFNYKPETDMFGGSLSSLDNNNMAKQNSGQLSKSQFDQIPPRSQQSSRTENSYLGQMTANSNISPNINQISKTHVSNSRYTYNPYLANNQPPFGLHDNNQPVGKTKKTTSIPVVDTSTHRSGKLAPDNIASRMKLPLQPSPNLNAPDVQDMPVNLFKDKVRNTFKAPVLFERFTNYQVGQDGKQKKILPEKIQESSNSPEQAKNMSATHQNFHLNAGIHSPQNYFGQDHYIAHGVELSVPAFGGPETQDFQSQQELYINHHEIPQAQNALPSFRNEHLNYDLHSPDNYFDNGPQQTQQAQQANQAHFPLKMISTKTKPDIANAGVQDVSNYDNSFTATTSATDPVKVTQIASTSPSVTSNKVMAQTTDALNYQMMELNNLRKKLERLQSLINQRKVGSQPEITTTIIPKPDPKPQDNLSETKQALTQETSNVDQYGNQINNIPNVPMYNNNNMPMETQYTGVQPSNTETSAFKAYMINLTKPSTVPPGMDRKTTKYINEFKAQMLQSIQDANAKKQKFSGTLRNKKADVIPTKPYNKETTYVTPPFRFGDQKSRAFTALLNKQSQIQNQQRIQEDAQRQSQINIENELKKKKEQEKQQKYRKLIELLKQRRRQRKVTAAQQQEPFVSKQPNQKPLNENQGHDRLQSNTMPTHREQHLPDHQTQHQQMQTQHNQNQNYQPSNQREPPNQQNLHKKPVFLPAQLSMAEVQTQSAKKQRISQSSQTTSVRPGGRIQAPRRTMQPNDFKKSATIDNSNNAKTTAVKTTIDRLADRLAVGMAEKIKSGSKNALPGFKNLPLSSGSVMETLRNIARSVLKEKNFRGEITETSATNNHNAMQKPKEPKPQLLEKPSAREMYLPQSVQKQKIINVNAFATDINEIDQLPSTSQQPVTKAYQNPVQNSQDQDRLAKRQELIRKMKQIMLKRRQKHTENTTSSNNNKPGHPSKVSPSQQGHPEVAGVIPLQSNSNNRPAQIDKYPNNDKPTIYEEQTPSNQNVFSEAYTPLKQTTKQMKQMSKTGIDMNTSVTTKTIQVTQNYQSDNSKSKRKLSPNIAKSMLVRVREMLANKKSSDGKSDPASLNADPGKSTRDVLNMPLSRDVLYRLLQSMQKQKAKRPS